jgi:hypothetical protein
VRGTEGGKREREKRKVARFIRTTRTKRGVDAPPPGRSVELTRKGGGGEGADGEKVPEGQRENTDATWRRA